MCSFGEFNCVVVVVVNVLFPTWYAHSSPNEQLEQNKLLQSTTKSVFKGDLLLVVMASGLLVLHLKSVCHQFSTNQLLAVSWWGVGLEKKHLAPPKKQGWYPSNHFMLPAQPPVQDSTRSCTLQMWEDVGISVWFVTKQQEKFFFFFFFHLSWICYGCNEGHFLLEKQHHQDPRLF